MEKLVTVGTVADFDFTNIPQNFRHLELDLDAHGSHVAGVQMILEINGDVGNNYIRLVQWQGGKLDAFVPGPPVNFTWIAGANSPAGWKSNAFVKFFNYARSDIFKTWQSRGYDVGTGVINSAFIYDAGGTFLLNNPITRIRTYPAVAAITAVSLAQLYGYP